MIRIKPYDKSYKALWDSFIEHSKNGTFMLKRDYVEYHADRFKDYSLMFFDDDTLIALMCASLHGCEIRSHGGLTFGGIITDRKITAQKMLDIFACLLGYLRDNGIQTLLYKRVPMIYHSYPSDEDLYALFRMGAKLVRRDISSTIYMHDKISFNQRRKRNIKKARNANLSFKQSFDFEGYIALLSEVLATHHGAKPTHSTDELKYLANKFPDNIKLYASYDKCEMRSGVVIYETQNVAHAQYIANSQKGRECGALDLVFDKLINEIYVDKQYFDFGISTENNGFLLNSGLIQQKQEFGGRGVVYDTFALNVAHAIIVYGGGEYLLIPRFSTATNSQVASLPKVG